VRVRHDMDSRPQWFAKIFSSIKPFFSESIIFF